MSAARVYGIAAPQANQVVLLRRGPSKQTLQLLWDCETDEITPGQWIKGRVYERRCDVSPDGRYLIGAFTNYSAEDWEKCGWTALSRPPYFTALALWFTGGAWNGGGIWRSPTEVGLNNFAHHWTTAKPVQRPVVARELDLSPSENEPLYSMLLRARGWSEVVSLKTRLRNKNWRAMSKKLMECLSQPRRLAEFSLDLIEQCIPQYDVVREGVWEREIRNGKFRRIDGYRSESWQLLDLEGRLHREWKVPEHRSFWLELDARGDVLFADSGCVYRWSGFPNGKAMCVGDLNPFRFESVAPPEWALEW